jgi:tetratricopeptide (TPR) repeat protein
MKSCDRNTMPLEAQYLYRRGLELANQGRDDEALRFLRQAVFLSPGFVKACLEIGDCLARLGRHGEACEYYARVLRLDPAWSERVSGKIFSCRDPPESNGFLVIPLF